MLTGNRWRQAKFGGGAGEARGRCWLHDAAVLNEDLPGGVVSVAGRFQQRQHWRDTGVRFFENGFPLITRAAPEGVRENGLQGRPLVFVSVVGQDGGIEAKSLYQCVIEGGLEGTHGDVAAVGRLVDLVVGRASVG